MRRKRKDQSAVALAANPIIVGAVAMLVLVIGVFLAYNANKGLPFVPTYQVTVEVPDAAELIPGDDVKIGGGRVGQVSTVTAIPAKGGHPAFARLRLSLNSTTKVPADTTVAVRPQSLLGGKYVLLTPGKSSHQTPDGGTLALTHTRPVVELAEAFNIFDAQTTKGIQGVVQGLGDTFAGRGFDFNAALGSTATLLPPTQRLLRVLIAPSTNLERFLRGAAATTSALAPVAAQLGALFDAGAITLRAIDAAGPALGQTIEQLPPTESTATTALTHIAPVLSDAAAISKAILPGTALLPSAARRLNAAVRAGIPTLRRAPSLVIGLRGTLDALDALARDPSATNAVRLLTATVTSLRPTLEYLGPAQIVCNIGGIWTRNVPSSISEGDPNGSLFRTVLVLNVPEMLQSAKPDSQLHVNYYPNANASECEAGNEPFLGGQQIGNPPGSQSTQVPLTSPPAEATRLAQSAGLLTPVPGATP